MDNLNNGLNKILGTISQIESSMETTSKETDEQKKEKMSETMVLDLVKDLKSITNADGLQGNPMLSSLNGTLCKIEKMAAENKEPKASDLTDLVKECYKSMQADNSEDDSISEDSLNFTKILKLMNDLDQGVNNPQQDNTPNQTPSRPISLYSKDSEYRRSIAMCIYIKIKEFVLKLTKALGGQFNFLYAIHQDLQTKLNTDYPFTLFDLFCQYINTKVGEKLKAHDPTVFFEPPFNSPALRSSELWNVLDDQEKTRIWKYIDPIRENLEESMILYNSPEMSEVCDFFFGEINKFTPGTNLTLRNIQSIMEHMISNNIHKKISQSISKQDLKGSRKQFISTFKSALKIMSSTDTSSSDQPNDPIEPTPTTITKPVSQQK